MLVGPIWGGFVTQGSGWGAMGWSLAVLASVGAAVAALLVGGWVGRKGERGTGDGSDGRKEEGGV